MLLRFQNRIAQGLARVKLLLGSPLLWLTHYLMVVAIAALIAGTYLAFAPPNSFAQPVQPTGSNVPPVPQPTPAPGSPNSFASPLPAPPPADFAPTNYVTQFAEQDTSGRFSPQAILEQTVDTLLAPLGGFMNIVKDMATATFSAFIKPIGQISGAILAMFIKEVMKPFTTYLMGILQWFVLNPNIPLAIDGGGAASDNQITGGQINPFAASQKTDPSLHNLQVLCEQMKTLSLDVSLLLFVLAIWRRWLEGAFRGGRDSLMGPVGRLIFTMALILTWREIYKVELMITNEMVKAIFFNTPVEFELLNSALVDAMLAAIAAGAGLAVEVFAPVVGVVAGGAVGNVPGAVVGGAIGAIIGFIGLVMFAIFGGILIAQMCYLLVLKAVQTAMLVAQYVFADMFLVFYASPDTEHIATAYVKSFIEISLWTFAWLGLFKIMVIVIASQATWGKLLIVIGLLQIMISIPKWIGNAQISPASDFINPQQIMGFMKEGTKRVAALAQAGTMSAAGWQMNGKFTADGSDQVASADFNPKGPAPSDGSKEHPFYVKGAQNPVVTPPPPAKPITGPGSGGPGGSGSGGSPPTAGPTAGPPLNTPPGGPPGSPSSGGSANVPQPNLNPVTGAAPVSPPSSPGISSGAETSAGVVAGAAVAGPAGAAAGSAAAGGAGAAAAGGASGAVSGAASSSGTIASVGGKAAPKMGIPGPPAAPAGKGTPASTDTSGFGAPGQPLSLEQIKAKAAQQGWLSPTSQNPPPALKVGPSAQPGPGAKPKQPIIDDTAGNDIPQVGETIDATPPLQSAQNLTDATPEAAQYPSAPQRRFHPPGPASERPQPMQNFHSPVDMPVTPWFQKVMSGARQLQQGAQDRVFISPKNGRTGVTYTESASLERRAELGIAAGLIEDSYGDGGFQQAARRSAEPTKLEKVGTALASHGKGGGHFHDTERGKARTHDEMLQGTMHYVTGGRHGRQNAVSQYLTDTRGQYGDGSPDRGTHVQTDLRKFGFMISPAHMAAEKNATVAAQADQRHGPLMRAAAGKYMERKLHDEGQPRGSYGLDHAIGLAHVLPNHTAWAALTVAQHHGDDAVFHNPELVDSVASVGAELGGTSRHYEAALAAVKFQQREQGGGWSAAEERVRELKEWGFKGDQLLDPRIAAAHKQRRDNNQPCNQFLIMQDLKGKSDATPSSTETGSGQASSAAPHFNHFEENAVPPEQGPPDHK